MEGRIMEERRSHQERKWREISRKRKQKIEVERQRIKEAIEK